MSPEALNGLRVLLIVIPEGHVQTACVLAGMAEWTGEELHVQVAPDRAPVIVRGSRAALEGFDPARLPRLIVPRYYPQVAALARDVHAGVAVWAPDAPADGVVLESPFYGLAIGRDNQVFLMQGDPASR